jgi:cysteine desulfurase
LAPLLYLDANASEPLRPAARAAALAALDLTGNPASVHAAGRAARRLLEDVREALASHFATSPADVVLTAGGTEANALAVAALGAGRRVLRGATEHPAVVAATPAAAILPVLPDGTADLEALNAALAGQPPALVCLMAANNETGVLHPLAAAAAICAAHGAALHVDGVQAAGRVAIPPVWDSLALSGHKLGGPKGAGALLFRRGLAARLAPAPLVAGGGQEGGWRGGTEALPALAGMAAALIVPGSSALAALAAEIAAGAEGAILAGGTAPRLPNTLNLILPGVAAERQVIALDLAGIAVSAGAACSSGKVASSAVLAAMGFGADAGCGIRVSLPWNAPPEAPAQFLAAWRAMRDRMRPSPPAPAAPSIGG